MLPRNAYGWAPENAAKLLEKSRLDWQVSLACFLRNWEHDPPEEETDAALILAWVNVGSLAEGAMKLFLSVFLRDYEAAPDRGGRVPQRGPEELGFEVLRQFFKREVLTEAQVTRWNPWLERIQQRRNAIHAYKDRDIGSFSEFRGAVKELREFLDDILGRLPYPDSHYA